MAGEHKGARGYKEIYETFDMDNINTSVGNGIRWLVSTDGSQTAFAVVAGSEGPMAMGTLAADAPTNSMIEIGHGLVSWEAQHGELLMEVGFQIDPGTAAALTIGFNDDELDDSNTLPVELSGTAFTANGSSFIGFVYDTDATNDNWHCYWADDGAATTTAIGSLRMVGAKPEAGYWGVYRLSLQDQGSGNQVRATFTYIDHKGKAYEKTFGSTIDRDVLLTPHIAVEDRGGTATLIPQISYIYLKQSLA